jgi:hypothetical protein
VLMRDGGAEIESIIEGGGGKAPPPST